MTATLTDYLKMLVNVHYTIFKFTVVYICIRKKFTLGAEVSFSHVSKLDYC